MNSFIQNYEIILTSLKNIEIETTVFPQIRKPRLSNIELIAMNLTAEYMCIVSDCQLFRVISNTYFEGIIERSVYNRRKRRLFFLMESIRKYLASKFNEFEDYYIVDSMPIEV